MRFHLELTEDFSLEYPRASSFEFSISSKSESTRWRALEEFSRILYLEAICSVSFRIVGVNLGGELADISVLIELSIALRDAMLARRIEELERIEERKRASMEKERKLVELSSISMIFGVENIFDIQGSSRFPDLSGDRTLDESIPPR